METNDNGVVKTMRVQAVNDGGVIRLHRKITENSDGVLREIFTAYPDPISGSYSFEGGTKPSDEEIGSVFLSFPTKATIRMSNIKCNVGDFRRATILCDKSVVIEGLAATVAEIDLDTGIHYFGAVGFGVTGSGDSTTYYSCSFDYEITFGGTT